METSNLSSFFSNLLLVHSLGLHSYESWNFPSWSISVEFYTYIIFFIFVLVTKNRKSFLIPILSSIFCYSFLTYLFPQGHFLRTYDYGIIRCVGGFFAGVAVYSIYSIKKLQIGNYYLISFLELLVVGIIYYTISISDASGENKLISFLFFAIAIYIFASQEKGFISKILLNEPFQLLGKLSYSIYMVHAIIIVSLNNIFIHGFHYNVSKIELNTGEKITGIVTQWASLLNTSELIVVIFISYLTYKYIENPWRKRFRRLAEKVNVSKKLVISK